MATTTSRVRCRSGRWRQIAMALALVWAPIVLSIANLVLSDASRTDAFTIPVGAGYLLLNPGSRGKPVFIRDCSIVRCDDAKGPSSVESLGYLAEESSLCERRGYHDGWAECVPAVIELSIHPNRIIGKTRFAYFVLNTRLSRVRYYDTIQAVAKALSIDDTRILSSGLETPENLSRTLHWDVLRPWDYANMHGRWGHPDSWWSALAQSSGIVAAFLVGLALPFYNVLSIVVKVLAIWLVDLEVNTHAYFHLIGPDVFAGMILFFPIYTLAAVWGSWTYRYWFRLLGRQRPAKEVL